MFAIGDTLWPGISKLTEEAGEICQVTGKLMGTGGDMDHWDGTDLGLRLEEELGDLMAAVMFVTEVCQEVDATRIHARASEKLKLFIQWREEQTDGD